MPSVVGLLEEHELAARRRVDALREEADRIQAELAMAEREWSEWTIAREHVGAVLSAPGSDSADVVATDVPEGVVTGAEVEASAPLVVKARSQVPMWREGLDQTALSVDYQPILAAIEDRIRLGQGPLTCQEMATALLVALRRAEPRHWHVVSVTAPAQADDQRLRCRGYPRAMPTTSAARSARRMTTYRAWRPVSVTSAPSWC
ncbi:hypothetical protein OG778_30270 [Streptomyces sp. NBC_00184]|uniref:hypothetical protein n=1 Tax=Streptomyces sp. NBC_00184 TaxID=2975673 RepID=UPI002E28DF55|nr:hypothetical protein [Streptomyces sp. NBC_00184]